MGKCLTKTNWNKENTIGRKGPYTTKWAEELCSASKISPADLFQRFPGPKSLKKRCNNLSGLWDWGLIPPLFEGVCLTTVILAPGAWGRWGRSRFRRKVVDPAPCRKVVSRLHEMLTFETFSPGGRPWGAYRSRGVQISLFQFSFGFSLKSEFDESYTL